MVEEGCMVSEERVVIDKEWARGGRGRVLGGRGRGLDTGKRDNDEKNSGEKRVWNRKRQRT